MFFMDSILRHCLAAVAYRGKKVLEGAPENFENFQIDGSPRTAGNILSHMGDLYDWALSMAEGNMKWQQAVPQNWDQEAARFLAALMKFDGYLASGQTNHADPERLMQGPIADSLTHIGQLAMMRRQAGAPVKAENYYKAEIRKLSL